MWHSNGTPQNASTSRHAFVGSVSNDGIRLVGAHSPEMSRNKEINGDFLIPVSGASPVQTHQYETASVVVG